VTTEPVRAASYVASGTEATVAITGRTFIMTDVARATLRVLDDSHYAFVNESTQGLLSRELGAGLEAGESIDQMARRISEVFGTRKSQSTRIARTEVASAVQSAQLEGYKQTGVVERQMWNTSLDDRVRDSHMIDGQTVGLDELFTLTNGAQAEGPAGVSLEPEDRINCRCFRNPVFVDEDAAELVIASAAAQAADE
jgi:SPP1 gp7 family putative phage head morphogenesis protein